MTDSEFPTVLVKHCEGIDFHPPHDVQYFEDAEEGEEDYSCPGIQSVADRVAALERRSEEYDEVVREMFQAKVLNTELMKQVEYHREQHGVKSRALQEATTSPDTKAAHEAGYKSGFAAAQARPSDMGNLERAVDRALLAPLQHIAQLERDVTLAAQMLNAAYARINAAFNPPPVERVTDPVEQLAQALGTTGDDLRAQARAAEDEAELPHLDGLISHVQGEPVRTTLTDQLKAVGVEGGEFPPRTGRPE